MNGSHRVKSGIRVRGCAMESLAVPALWIIGIAVGATLGFLDGRLLRWGLADTTIPTATTTKKIRMALLGMSTVAVTTYVIGPSVQLPAWWWFALSGILLTRADLLRHRLPDRLVFPVLIGGVCLLGATALAEASATDLVRACLAALVVGVGYLLLALLAPTGLGMGDVKLSPLIGLYLGWMSWSSVIVGVCAGFIVGAVWALILLVTRQGGLHTRLPFGPSMLLGVAVAALLHARV